MRVCYAIVAAAAIIAAHSETVVAVANSKQNHLAADNSPLSIDSAQINSSTKRSLSGIEKLQKLVVAKQPKTITIEELLKPKELDEILDPKRVDEIFAKGKLGGWMDKETLDKIISGNFIQKNEIFEKWHASRRTSRLVRQILRSHPAMEKKYRFVYTMYGEYLKGIYSKQNKAKRVAAAAAATRN